MRLATRSAGMDTRADVLVSAFCMGPPFPSWCDLSGTAARSLIAVDHLPAGYRKHDRGITDAIRRYVKDVLVEHRDIGQPPGGENADTASVTLTASSSKNGWSVSALPDRPSRLESRRFTAT